jgi:threonine/homoserine/homoserine lactone efflux protein
MVDSQVIAFTLAAASLTLVPGANDMLVMRNVLRGGRRDGILTACGICAGLFVHATLSAFGPEHRPSERKMPFGPMSPI